MCSFKMSDKNLTVFPGKIMHEQIDFPGRSLIKVKVQDKERFTYPWHFHPEYELLYVIKGEGNSYVADSIEKFRTGDLVMTGSNLPHFWKEKTMTNNEAKLINIRYVVIQFSDTFLKEAISEYPEFQMIKDLLKRSGRGIRFNPGFTKKIVQHIFKVVNATGFERILYMLQLLQKLATTNKYRLLAGELYEVENYDFASDRFTKVMHYLNTNYLNKVELENVAAVASMHPAAFCRYFKENSGKSLTEFVNHMRISYACRLLMEKKFSVSQVCFESGFNNLSNFNRIFKKHTGFTPTSYINEYHKS